MKNPYLNQNINFVTIEINSYFWRKQTKGKNLENPKNPYLICNFGLPVCMPSINNILWRGGLGSALVDSCGFGLISGYCSVVTVVTVCYCIIILWFFVWVFFLMFYDAAHPSYFWVLISWNLLFCSMKAWDQKEVSVALCSSNSMTANNSRS